MSWSQQFGKIHFCEVTHFTSKYKGVSRNGQLWAVTIFFNSRRINGGRYCDELDAAKRVNQLCDKLKIAQKNPGIGSMPNPKVNNTFFVMTISSTN
jgi:hypothetical protein